MAQVDVSNNPNDPNNPNAPGSTTPNQPPGQSATNQPATSSGAGAVTATGAGNVTGQVAGTNNPTQPFQNIASYLSANAPQSEALANQVASSVSAPINQAQNDITNASGTFSNAVTGGFTPENKSLISAVSTDPATAAADPNNVAAFQAQLNDTYKGPTDFTAAPQYANLESEVANAQSLGQNAQTPTGIQTLLQGVEGPTTAGINNLDTLLLAQDPANFKTIANAGSVADTTNNNLANFLTSQTTTNNAAAQTGLTAAQQAAVDAAAGLNTAATSTAGGVNAAYDSDITETESYNQALSALQNAIATGNLGNLTPAQQAEIGFNPDAITAISDFASIFPTETKGVMPNIPLYYSGPQSATLPVSAQQVETPQQAAAIAALLELNGGNTLTPLSGLSGTAPTTPYTVPTDMGQFDNAQLSNYLYDTVLPTYEEFQSAPSNTNFGGSEIPAQINSWMQFLQKYRDESEPSTNPPLQPLPPGSTGPASTGGRASA